MTLNMTLVRITFISFFDQLDNFFFANYLFFYPTLGFLKNNNNNQ